MDKVEFETVTVTVPKIAADTLRSLSRELGEPMDKVVTLAVFWFNTEGRDRIMNGGLHLRPDSPLYARSDEEFFSDDDE
ncbi:hypothetical protein [Bifidobacterium myosotis]|uniref:Uncharacterized protein n=1 Tax=Bifidobacterium myosotis TaxID=1630166 RepID=A0A5M9ZHS4_9BIFI|nr:hypothetical protein [Bifidobacterium myosotis]KAA8826933.1 hypothetical protein EMO91_10405 [Bifidobacterium myosotis]